MSDLTLIVASRTEGLFRWSAATGLSPFAPPVDKLLTIARHPVLPVLYGSGNTGHLHAWRLDTGAVIAEIPSGDPESCHLLVEANRLLVANYEAGILSSQPLAADGSFAGTATTVQFTGSGPEAGRQEMAHPHHVMRRGDTLFVVDLGADMLRELSLDLVPGRTTQLPPGTGPRHAVILPDGRFAITGELNAHLLVGRPGDPAAAWASVPSSTRTGPAKTRTPRNYPGDIQRSADGRFVYVANRGHDTIATFDVSGAVPRLVSEHDATVAWPQYMLVRDDQLLVAGWDSSRVVSMPLKNGEPGAVEPLFDCPGPMWMLSV